MVVDTSAAIAIMAEEPGSDELLDAFDSARPALMSTATLVELGIVMEARRGPVGMAVVDRFIAETAIQVVAVDAEQARLAVTGWRTYGKGRHPVALNYGDCFTYGLATLEGLPVLCTGNDFLRTDVEVLPAR